MRAKAKLTQRLALKLSNVASIIVWFSVGYQWTKYADRNRIRTGAGIVLTGFVISAVATLLGG